MSIHGYGLLLPGVSQRGAGDLNAQIVIREDHYCPLGGCLALQGRVNSPSRHHLPKAERAGLLRVGIVSRVTTCPVLPKVTEGRFLPKHRELQSDGVWIYDLGSGGGSRLDSVGVITDRPRCPFPDDAILWIGQVAFRVEIGR